MVSEIDLSREYVKVMKEVKQKKKNLNLASTIQKHKSTQNCNYDFDKVMVTKMAKYLQKTLCKIYCKI